MNYSGSFSENFLLYEELIFEDLKDETGEFPYVNCIKIFSSKEEKMTRMKKHAFDIIIKMFKKYVDYVFLCRNLRMMWTLENFDIMDLG